MLPLDLSKLKVISDKLKERNLKIYFALENCFFKDLEDIKYLYLSHICRDMQLKLSPKFKEIKSQII